MKVLVVGAAGVGVELAKNSILQGTRSVTLYDPSPVEMKDIGVNFCLAESDVGMRRDAVSVPKLQELSKECKVLGLDLLLGQ